ETYTSAQQLCQHLEAPQQLFSALRGLWQYYHVRTEYQTAHALGEQLLALAQQAQDATRLVAAHAALGRTLFFLGTGASAHTHFLQGIALYDPQQHRTSAFLYGEDAVAVCHSFAARALCSLGYPDQALARNQQAVTLAQQRAHPYSLSFALGNAAIFHQLRREGRAAQEHAEALITLATDQGFPHWRAQGAILRGWTLAQQGQAQAGIEQSHHGFRATGAEISRPYFLALLAEAHGILGEPEPGLAVLTEALTHVYKTGERWHEAELHRLQGALLLQQNWDNQAEAETGFAQAMTIA